MKQFVIKPFHDKFESDLERSISKDYFQHNCINATILMLVIKELILQLYN